MKNLEESIYNKLISETPKRESEEAIFKFAKDSEFGLTRKGSNFVIKSTSDDRKGDFQKLKNILSPLGFDHDTTRGGSLGRLVLPAGKDEKGNKYNQTTVVVKPASGGGSSAAKAGAEYEDKLANYITNKYADQGVNAFSAGSGHGSDLTIVADGSDSMTIEVKTAMGADFGQFKIGFLVKNNSWSPIRTKQYEKNETLFRDIFKTVVAPYMNSKAKFSRKALGLSSMNIKDNVVRGLKPDEKTGLTKKALQAKWFDGKTDIKLPFSFEKISKYYASKGDRFIQIGPKGLYALNQDDASAMGVPYFGDIPINAMVRIRIKPHAGTNGTHSFTAAIKLSGKFANSPLNLNNDTDLDKVVDNFLDAQPLEEAKKPNPKDHTTLSIEDMEAAVQKAQSIKKIADDKKLAKNIPGDEYRKLPSVSDKFQIIVPMSTRASCLYGAGTKWCTAASEDNQFNRYYNRWGMTLYYVLPKKVDVDWDVVDAEEEDFHNQLDDLFEGKVQDLQKKYPDIDVTALKDPSGKNKYLAWMAKTVDGIGTTERSRLGATVRVNNVIDYYHKLLPYIGREEKPEKKKEKGQRQERTRFDKLAIVMHPEGYRSKMYDAQDKDIELKDLISFIMPTWGIDPKEGLDVFGAVEDVIIDDMADNPNPVAGRKEKIQKAADSLYNDLNSNYHDNLVPNFFNDPEKASQAPVAYGTLKNFKVEAGSLVLPYTFYIYLPIPDEIGGYEKITKDQTFRGNDRARLDDFRGMLRQNMELWKPPTRMGNTTLKSFRAADEKYNDVTDSSTFKERTPREADISYVGPVKKQRFILLEMRANIMIKDRSGAIPAEELDDVMLNVVGDVRNFMENDISDIKELVWDEFQFMAKRWMEQNPRKSPEEEKVEADKATDDIMAQLPEERQTMSLEEKILKRLMGEELLLEAVSYEQAQAALTGKPALKIIKSYNFERGEDPMKDASKMIDSLFPKVMTAVPADVLPAAITNDPSMDRMKKEKEIEDRRALGIMWMLRLMKQDKEFAAMMLGDDPRHQGQSTIRAIRQNMEKFFQHPNHMKVRSLDQIKTSDDLANVVDAAQKSIDAENDKKMGADAGQGTEFFAGGFKRDENGDIMRDEEGIPLFRFSKDGWVIAAAHNKGAACLLGKKTNWCTAAPGLNYFDTYYNGTDDPLFFIHTPATGDADGDRFQFAFGCDDCPQFMDVEDTPVRGEEFERLHDKLKDVLRDNGFEDRFDVVFNYEHFDFHEAMDKLVTSERARIDNPQVQIHGDVDDDYDSINLNAGFNVAFVYSFDPNKFTPVDDLNDYDGIINVFSEITNMHVGAQEDNYGEDGQENVDYDAGHSTVKLEIGGWMSSWASSESAGEDSMHEVNNFFSDVNSNIDGMYDELKGKLQVALVELGALPLTKYDKLLSDEINVWDGEHANQDDEDEPGEYGDPNDKPEPKDLAERQEAFEEQFKNVLVAFDDELSEITFQGLSFPAPTALASDEVSVFGESPKNKDYILRRALITMEQVMDRQPNLPGMEEGDDEDFEMFRGVVSRNDIVGYFFTFKTVCKLEIEMKLGVLTESEMDSVVAGMKVIDRNFKLFQIAMRDALERYIEMNPDEMRWAKDKAEPPADPAAQGNAIGGRLGAPVRAEGISEIVADEVAKAMNEIEPYQKKAKKLQKKAMELSIKGPNKYMTKGMKIATAKPGKSAPPGV